MWKLSRGKGAWDPRFLRLFHDWEMVAVQNFIHTVNNRKVTSSKKDRLLWKVDKNGSFTVKAFYAHLEGEIHHSAP